MRYKFVAVLLLLSVPALAQVPAAAPPSPTQNELFLQQAVAALRVQREAAEDDAASAYSQINLLQTQLANLQKQVGEDAKAAKSAADAATAKEKQMQSQITDLQKQLAAGTAPAKTAPSKPPVKK